MVPAFAALALAAIVVIAGWPWIKPYVTKAIVKGQVLFFTAPRPDAQAVVLNMTGVEIKGRFVGSFTTQHAQVAPEAKRGKSPIILP